MVLVASPVVVASVGDGGGGGGGRHHHGPHPNDQSSHQTNPHGEDDWRRRSFFKYERRLREKSSGRKVYEYFANQEVGGGDGRCVMSVGDVMRSLCCVYPNGWMGRSGGLRGEEVVRGRGRVEARFAREDARMLGVEVEEEVGGEIGGRFRGTLAPPKSQSLPEPRRRRTTTTTTTTICDHPSMSVLRALSEADGEVGVSFVEWSLVDALVGCGAASTRDLELMFGVIDVDGSGRIDEEELEAVVRGLVRLDGVGGGAGWDGGNAGNAGNGGLRETVMKLMGVMRGMMRRGETVEATDGGVTVEAFAAFVQALREAIELLHYAHYCTEGVRGVSVGRLLVSIVAAHADIRVVDGLLDRIEAGVVQPAGGGSLCTFETFRAMHALVGGQEFRDLLAACSLYGRFHMGGGGYLTRQGFRSSIAVLKGDEWLKRHGEAVEALFWLFERGADTYDSENDGNHRVLFLSDLHAAFGGARRRGGRQGGVEAAVAGDVGKAYGGHGGKLQCVLRCFNADPL